MFEHPLFKWIKLILGILAIVLILVFGTWLVLLIMGFPVDIKLFGYTIDFANYVRLLAEGLVAGLLLAALAFL